MRSWKLSFAELAVVLLIATLLVTFYALVNQNKRAQDVVVERAMDTAVVLANFAAAAHGQYADSIRGYTSEPGARLTMKPDEDPDAIRFPATFSRILTEQFSKQYPSTAFRIYSRYPFGNRQNTELDAFGDAALYFLENNPSETYRRIEVGANEGTVVRYAEPIVLKASCVACHNGDVWQLSKQDWKVGEVRGVREVAITLPPTALHTRAEVTTVFGLLLVSCGLGVFWVFPAVRREVASRAYFHGLSSKLDDKAKKYQEEAYTDRLTGIRNRRYFDEIFESMAADVLAGRLDLSLVILDIDHFKSVNDTHGHAAGDEVIAAVGSFLKRDLRGKEKACRIGGEEFAILLPGVSAREARGPVERLRKLVSSQTFEAEGKEFSVTMSAGIAQMQADESHRAFFKRTDALLYQAKQTGRDRSCSDWVHGQAGWDGAPANA